MNQLYPIIRRVRRPLLPVDERPPVVVTPPTVVPAPVEAPPEKPAKAARQSVTGEGRHADGNPR
jgi:hypothetical protein